MPSEPEFPANLRAFCELVIECLGHESVDYVLDVLDENFNVVQDRAHDCCFDQGLAWSILEAKH